MLAVVMRFDRDIKPHPHLENAAREAGFDTDVPVEIYLPPDGVWYTKKTGKYVAKVPVFNQETAFIAIEKLTQNLNDFIRGDTHSAWVTYPMRQRQINLERLYSISEQIEPDTSYMETEETQ